MFLRFTCFKPFCSWNVLNFLTFQALRSYKLCSYKKKRVSPYLLKWTLFVWYDISNIPQLESNAKLTRLHWKRTLIYLSLDKIPSPFTSNYYTNSLSITTMLNTIVIWQINTAQSMPKGNVGSKIWWYYFDMFKLCISICGVFVISPNYSDKVLQICLFETLIR